MEQLLWGTALVFSVIAIVMLLGLIWSIFRAGKYNVAEVARLQGTTSDVWNGRVANMTSLPNDPRIIEGMEAPREKPKNYKANKRVSDDYLKQVFGN